MNTPKTLTIDPKFEGLCRPLTENELRGLRESLADDGCRDSIVVWRGNGTILDGHNRYRLCQESVPPIPFQVRELAMLSRADAERWIIENQLSRRNLSPRETDFLRGNRFGVEKRELGGNLPENAQKTLKAHNEPLGDTAAKLAEEYGVSRETIKRDAEFAEAVNIASEKAPEIKGPILAGRVDKKDVAGLAGAEAEQLRELAALPADEQRRAAKEIVAALAGRHAKPATAPVPSRLQPVFARHAEFRGILAELTRAKKRIEALAADEAAGVLLRDVADFRQLLEGLENLRHAVKFSLPYAACPWCGGKEHVGCKPCDGRGWVNETVFRNAPKERRGK